MKVAVASSDGKNVNEHFGRAETFYIYELQDGLVTLVEKRKTLSYSTWMGDPAHKFDADRFEAVFSVIKDCMIVYVERIGDVPALKLKEKGIKPVEHEGRISKIFFLKKGPVS